MPTLPEKSRKGKIDGCRANGVEDIIELKIGYDGIVVANSIDGGLTMLTLTQIYLALAKFVPNPDGSQSFILNPYVKWSDIDALLPSKNIRVLGPPPTSGTRDAFVEIGMEDGCKSFDWIRELHDSDKAEYKLRCHTLREDGAFVEAGENDNLIVQKLKNDADAYGILGFSFLDQNTDVLQGSVIDGDAPTFEAISDGSYRLSRALYVYVKGEHLALIDGLLTYVDELTSERASGAEGYLSDKGMIPASADERERNRGLLPAPKPF